MIGTLACKKCYRIIRLWADTVRCPKCKTLFTLADSVPTTYTLLEPGDWYVEPWTAGDIPRERTLKSFINYFAKKTGRVYNFRRTSIGMFIGRDK